MTLTLAVILRFEISSEKQFILQYLISITSVDNQYTAGILVQYTLPQINAALFPLIIILRKPSLKQKYKEFLLKVLVFPANMASKIWSWLHRRQGYETLA